MLGVTCSYKYVILSLSSGTQCINSPSTFYICVERQVGQTQSSLYLTLG